MSHRVIQWATGTVGIQAAVPAIVRHPDLQPPGPWVHSDDKAAYAGELCGIDPAGITATQDVDAGPARRPTAFVTRRTPTAPPGRGG